MALYLITAIKERASWVIYLTPIWDPFMEECINEKIRFQQMETSVRGDEFPVEAEKISHILTFSRRR